MCRRWSTRSAAAAIVPPPRRGTIRSSSGPPSMRPCSAPPGTTTIAAPTSSPGRSAPRTLTRLLNPPDLVRWNTHKFYLRDLAGRGVGHRADGVPSRRHAFRPGGPSRSPGLGGSGRQTGGLCRLLRHPARQPRRTRRSAGAPRRSLAAARHARAAVSAGGGRTGRALSGVHQRPASRTRCASGRCSWADGTRAPRACRWRRHPRRSPPPCASSSAAARRRSTRAWTCCATSAALPASWNWSWSNPASSSRPGRARRRIWWRGWKRGWLSRRRCRGCGRAPPGA